MRYAAFLLFFALLAAPALAAQDDKSVTDGGALFNRNCASCHGRSATGDGPAAKVLTPKPSNLTDDEWVHGGTDEEIYAVIRGGVPKTAMKGYASKMTEREIRDVIAYVRSLHAPAAGK